MTTPTHRAYSVIKREGKDDFWQNIGVVFAHEDGEGFNLCWRPCRSTATRPRTYKDEPEEVQQKKGKQFVKKSKRSPGRPNFPSRRHRPAASFMPSAPS